MCVNHPHFGICVNLNMCSLPQVHWLASCYTSGVCSCTMWRGSTHLIVCTSVQTDRHTVDIHQDLTFGGKQMQGNESQCLQVCSRTLWPLCGRNIGRQATPAIKLIWLAFWKVRAVKTRDAVSFLLSECSDDKMIGSILLCPQMWLPWKECFFPLRLPSAPFLTTSHPSSLPPSPSQL